jgi:hypothetical protein
LLAISDGDSNEDEAGEGSDWGRGSLLAAFVEFIARQTARPTSTSSGCQTEDVARDGQSIDYKLKVRENHLSPN